MLPEDLLAPKHPSFRSTARLQHLYCGDMLRICRLARKRQLMPVTHSSRTFSPIKRDLTQSRYIAITASAKCIRQSCKRSAMTVVLKWSHGSVLLIGRARLLSAKQGWPLRPGTKLLHWEVSFKASIKVACDKKLSLWENESANTTNELNMNVVDILYEVENSPALCLRVDEKQHRSHWQSEQGFIHSIDFPRYTYSLAATITP